MCCNRQYFSTKVACRASQSIFPDRTARKGFPESTLQRTRPHQGKCSSDRERSSPPGIWLNKPGQLSSHIRKTRHVEVGFAAACPILLYLLSLRIKTLCCLNAAIKPPSCNASCMQKASVDNDASVKLRNITCRSARTPFLLWAMFNVHASSEALHFPPFCRATETTETNKQCTCTLVIVVVVVAVVVVHVYVYVSGYGYVYVNVYVCE
jgi:hypothetical protein